MSIRPAATVVIVDDTMRVLLVQRNREIKFFGGAYAFPGGRVEPTDVPASGLGDPWASHLTPPAGLELCDDRVRLYAAYERAARREAAEESGLVLGGPLLLWARWITPAPEPKRYDTLFFVTRAQGTQVKVDGQETVAHRWLTPPDALALAKTGEIVLPPPTFVTLTELSSLSSWDAIAAVAAAGVPEVIPALVPEGDCLWLTLPQTQRGWPPGMPTRAKIVMTGEGVVATFDANA